MLLQAKLVAGGRQRRLDLQHVRLLGIQALGNHLRQVGVASHGPAEFAGVECIEKRGVPILSVPYQGAVDIHAILSALLGRLAEEHDHLALEPDPEPLGLVKLRAVGRFFGPGDRFVVQPARHEHVEERGDQVRRADAPSPGRRPQARQPHPGAVHVGVGIEHSLGRPADGLAPHRLLKGGPSGVGEQAVTLVARMDAVGRPELFERRFARFDPLLRQLDRIADRHAVGLGQCSVHVAALHSRERSGGDVPLKRKDDLHDGGLGLRQNATNDRLVAGHRFHVVGTDVVVGREVDQHQVGLVTQHVAIQAKHAQLRVCPADRRIPEPEMRLGIRLGEAVGELGAVTRQLGIGRIGTPGQRTAEEDDVETLAGVSAAVEPCETHILGSQAASRHG